MSATPNFASTIEELHAHRQSEQEAEDQCCAEGDQLFKEELKWLVEEQVEAEWKRVEKWKQEEEEQKKKLEEVERQFEVELWKKELKEARRGKKRVMDMEESGEEMEKELEGSNKK